MSNEEIVIKIQNGSSELISDLWKQNIGILTRYSRKLFNLYQKRCTSCGIELNDIIQECFFALLAAVKSYKPDGEYAFTSYLKYPIIKQFKKLCGINRITDDPLNQATSLNQISADGETEYIDTVVDENCGKDFEDVVDKHFNSQLRTVFDSVVEKLPKNCATTIQGKWFDGKTLSQIASEKGITLQYASQLEKLAFNKMRKDFQLRSFRNEILSNLAYKGTGLSHFNETGFSSVEWAVIRTDEILESCYCKDQDSKIDKTLE